MPTNTFAFILSLLFSFALSSANAQAFNLAELVNMRSYSLPDLQSSLIQKGYNLAHIEQNKLRRVDTVTFHNRDKDLVLTLVSKKRTNDNSISFTHGNDDSYLNFSNDLKTAAYKLIHSEAIASSGIKSYYVDNEKGTVIRAAVHYKKQEYSSFKNSVGQEYQFTILSDSDSQRVLKKYAGR